MSTILLSLLANSLFGNFLWIFYCGVFGADCADSGWQSIQRKSGEDVGVEVKYVITIAYQQPVFFVVYGLDPLWRLCKSPITLFIRLFCRATEYLHYGTRHSRSVKLNGGFVGPHATRTSKRWDFTKTTVFFHQAKTSLLIQRDKSVRSTELDKHCDSK